MAYTAPVLASGRIVASHDVNFLSTSHATASSARYAVNVADWLTQGRGNRLLLVTPQADSATHDYAPVILESLASAGYQVEVVTGTAWATEAVLDYDAVFFGQSRNEDGVLLTGSPDFGPLRTLLSRGGGVYVAAGVGPHAADEAAMLNGFLLPYGLAFEDRYNGYFGFEATVDSSHEVFEGVQSLFAGNGNSIVDQESFAGTSMVEFIEDSAVFATVERAECVADLDRDGMLLISDILLFVSNWSDGGTQMAVDFNDDGQIDVLDVIAFIQTWVDGCG